MIYINTYKNTARRSPDGCREIPCRIFAFQINFQSAAASHRRITLLSGPEKRGREKDVDVTPKIWTG